MPRWKITFTAEKEVFVEGSGEAVAEQLARTYLDPDLDWDVDDVEDVTNDPEYNDCFENGSPVPETPRDSGGAIPMPSSSELDDEEADRKRSYPDEP